jgi:hypothetical protein
MQRNGSVTNAPDLRHFDENRARFPLEQLLVYAGQHVAWSPNGTSILAFAPTQEEVDEKLEAVGIHFSQVVHDYIDPPLG